MGNHAPNRPVKYFGWRTVMEGSRFFGIYNVTLVEEVVVPKLHMSKLSCLEMTANFHPILRTLLRKKLPETLISSHRTTTIFWPERICFEIIEANRPRR